VFLLLVAALCWGFAITPTAGAIVRILLGVIGAAAFILQKWIRRKDPQSYIQS
jgi:hypothetical protein